MTSTSAERVALILDCLGHLDTDISGQTRLWRHADGRYVTEDEAAMIRQSTLRELERAMDLWHEQVVQLRERADLCSEWVALFAPYRTDSPEELRDAVARLPRAEYKRAVEIWQRIGPWFEAWKRDQS